MVLLECMTLNKPFSEYNPEEHKLNVAGLGERPRLIATEEPIEDEEEEDGTESNKKAKKGKIVRVKNWPAGVAPLLEEAWSQDVGERLSMQTVLQRLESIVSQLESDNPRSAPSYSCEETPAQPTTTSSPEQPATIVHTMNGKEVVLEFPSHFSPAHQLSVRSRRRQEQHLTPLAHQTSRDDSDCFGDKQSEASISYLELTMTSASTTCHDSSLHDSNSNSAH
jgi:hypothetical protein